MADDSCLRSNATYRHLFAEHPVEPKPKEVKLVGLSNRRKLRKKPKPHTRLQWARMRQSQCEDVQNIQHLKDIQ